MGLGLIFILVLILIILIWMFIEFKRMKHKIFAIFLIALILFFYFSITYVFKGNNVDFKSFSGLKNATNLYMSWLVSAFGNIKSITSNIIKMNWGIKNSTNYIK